MLPSAMSHLGCPFGDLIISWKRDWRYSTGFFNANASTVLCSAVWFARVNSIVHRCLFKATVLSKTELSYLALSWFYQSVIEAATLSLLYPTLHSQEWPAKWLIHSKFKSA